MHVVGESPRDVASQLESVVWERSAGSSGSNGPKQKRPSDVAIAKPFVFQKDGWLRGLDLNQRPPGYEPNEGIARLCFSMTYVCLALSSSCLFTGPLFPICSRFVPTKSDCTPRMRQFSMGTLAVTILWE